MALIGTPSLSNRYPKVTALDGLTVDVEPGIVGLIGANGAGPIDPAASVRTVRAYLRSFLDLALRHRDDGLLHRPSPRFPDAQLVTL